MWEGKKKGCHLGDRGILDVDRGDITKATDRNLGKKVFGEFLILQKGISIVFETSIFSSFSLFITSFNGLCLKTLLRNTERYLNHNCLILLHSTKLNK